MLLRPPPMPRPPPAVATNNLCAALLSRASSSTSRKVAGEAVKKLDAFMERSGATVGPWLVALLAGWLAWLRLFSSFHSLAASCLPPGVCPSLA
jgi:hypothetical protein